ncbi:MAG TPA: hypothetical protein VKA76_15725, partial [Gammaproteobacteria bacterium]|nr:hypothetical protein [Gammaproteobacteria bacterium]
MNPVSKPNPVSLTTLHSADGHAFRYTRESVEHIRRSLGLDLAGIGSREELGERFLEWIAAATDRCPAMTLALDSLLRYDGPDGRPEISGELEEELA